MLSLAQTQAITALAGHLYDYLPGSSQYRGTYTFAHAAQDAGVGAFWVPGSKRPALTSLLERTLDQRSSAFCHLLLIVVREGIKYRAKSDNPMTKEDLGDLNETIRIVGFKVPELWDPALAASLPSRRRPLAPADPAKPSEEAAKQTANQQRREARHKALQRLQERFLDLNRLTDRQAAGLGLEKLLQALFFEFDLQPRGSFVVPGEQIDGSIVLDGNSYLVEAKWEAGQVGLAPLAGFREKVAAKSTFTRGVFVSINGYGQNALSGITTGRQPNFLMMDGTHLFSVLHEDRDLVELLRTLLRELADKGKPYIPLPELPAP